MKYIVIEVKDRTAAKIGDQLWLDKLHIAEIIVNGVVYPCKLVNV